MDFPATKGAWQLGQLIRLPIAPSGMESLCWQVGQVTAQAFLKESGWEFAKDGQERLEAYLKKLAAQQEKTKK